MRLLRATAGNAAGDVILECDRDKGQIYVRPVSADKTKPLNLFISTAHATYTLVMQPVDMPADTIVIRDRAANAAPASSATARTDSASHVRALKNMVYAMATDEPAQELRVEEVGRPVALWAEVHFTLQRRFVGRNMTGERYLLTNVSSAPMVLAEQEFYREGVLGVAIENHNLRPGDSTSVHVVRAGSE